QAVRAREALGVALGVDHPVDARDEPSFAAPAPGGTDLNGRADIAFAGRAVWAAQRGNKDAWRDYLPTLSASFQPFYQNPATPTVPEWGWQAQLALALPLYDGGLRYGQALERSAALSAAHARYDLAVRQARADERTAHAAVEGADVALRKARSAATLAHEAAE